MKELNIQLSERKLRVLSAIIKSYIQTGEPVGSKAVVDLLDNSVSSATIRNDMAELAQLGLIEQPHTSAGRIPTQAGYRLYIDKLMTRYPLSDEEKKIIDDMLSDKDDPEKLLENASAALAELTNMAGLTTTPATEEATITHVELIPAGKRNAVIVLLSSNGIMKSKLCRSGCNITSDLIGMFYNIVQNSIIGQNICDITLPYIQTLAVSLGEHAFDMIPLLMSVYEASREAGESELCLKGQANLLLHPEYGGTRARELFEFLAQRDKMLSLLRRHKGGVSVVLGSEANQHALDGSSLLVANYRIGGYESGALGVLGPDRMNYAKLIPSLEYFAMRVGKLLSDVLGEGDTSEKDSSS